MSFDRSSLVVFGLALLAAGCSGGGGGGGNSGTPATPVPTASPTAVPTATPTVTPTSAPTPKPTASPTPTASPVPTGPVTATVSDSTNVRGYTIVLQQSGSATITQDGYTGTTTVAAADSAQFFKDLNMYSPIADVATLAHCTKSASYGTTVNLTYDNSKTGDVSCPPAPTAPAGYLYDDEQQIEKDMKAALGPFNH